MIRTTTFEQSEQLLNAGYLPETADAFWLRRPDFNGERKLMCSPVSSWNALTERPEDCVPAWSLSALWDLCEDLSLSFSTREDRSEGIIDTLVKKLIENSDILTYPTL